jgi:hypothetical protein
MEGFLVTMKYMNRITMDDFDTVMSYIEEQSASGLFGMDGVIVIKVEKNGKLGISGIIDGDVIVGGEGE